MLNDIGTEEIETESLILRRFKIDDAKSMFNNYCNDERVTKFLTWTPHKNIETTEALLNNWVESYNSPNIYMWAITVKGSNEVIGSIACVNVNTRNSSCSIGYCLAHDFWGRGYMTEALKDVIKYLFMKVNVNRITAYHDVKNSASGRVMAKSGMIREGILRQGAVNNRGEFINIVLYAILKDDYM